jgi:hypothetical protein
MVINKSTIAELVLFGIITAFFLGAFGKEYKTIGLIGSFYLFFQYLPYLPWVIKIDQNIFTKYVVINILGLFFSPMVLYFLNMLNVPIKLPTLIVLSLITFISGVLFTIRKNTINLISSRP